MSKKSIKLNLTDAERSSLRKNKVKISQVLDYATDELEVLLGATPQRAREVRALAEFQQVPSVGIKFAEDLVFMDYYSLGDLKDKDGAQLVDAYELKKGYWIDPCVEDQFRLIVHYAKTGDASRSWWDFTKERKAFRAEHGFPANRPTICWVDVWKK